MRKIIYVLLFFLLSPLTVYFAKPWLMPDLKKNSEAFERLGGVSTTPNIKGERKYTKLLQEYFKDPKIITVVELGCGDWRVMRNIKIPHDKIYLGFDVQSDLIAQNTKNFSKYNVWFYQIKNFHDFKKRNIKADLLIVKDVLQYLPEKDVKYFIKNILPNFKYALITNNYEQNAPNLNQNTKLGEQRPLALLQAPYNIPNTTVLFEYQEPKPQQVLLYKNNLLQRKSG